jgi:hypothetical protein
MAVMAHLLSRRLHRRLRELEAHRCGIRFELRPFADVLDAWQQLLEPAALSRDPTFAPSPLGRPEHAKRARGLERPRGRVDRVLPGLQQCARKKD